MARSRNIKPGFFTNDVLGELPPLARLLFAGLWTHCDREGRCEDRPKKIKAEVLPYDDCDADELLEQLRKAAFIDRYEVDGVRVIQVLTWNKHQNPHVKEAASSLPVRNEPGSSPVQEQCEQQPEPERAGLIPSSLIPDSLSLDSLEEKSARKRTPPLPCPDDVSEQTWNDWCALRKQKKASVTATVLAGARAEAEKASLTLEAFLSVWCLRGSQGLEASWLKPAERGQAPPSESFRARDTREAAEKFAILTGGLIGSPPQRQQPLQEVFDVTPRKLG